MRRALVVNCLLAAFSLSCGKDPQVLGPSPSPPTRPTNPTPAPTPTPKMTMIASDAELLTFVTVTDPFALYRLFPDADEIVGGTSAHQPVVRTSLNATAFDALVNGKLPAGATFPDGSVVFKEVRAGSGKATTYAVMYKSSSSSLARGGWLWAELIPGGATGYSIGNRGSGCVNCHSLGSGLRNDLVRTFERQH